MTNTNHPAAGLEFEDKMDMPDNVYLQFSKDGTQIRQWSRNAPEHLKSMIKYTRAALTAKTGEK